jgi:hypothetical protein
MHGQQNIKLIEYSYFIYAPATLPLKDSIVSNSARKQS